MLVLVLVLVVGCWLLGAGRPLCLCVRVCVPVRMLVCGCMHGAVVFVYCCTAMLGEEKLEV